MAKGISKTEETLTNSYLSQDEIDFLVNAGLTKLQVVNFIKKDVQFDIIKKKLKAKVADNQAKQYLRARLGSKMEVPERKLPKDPNWVPKNDKQELRLTYPMLPSANHMYQTIPNGSRQMTSEAKMLFMQLQDLVETEMVLQNWEAVHNKQMVIEMAFYFPDNRIRDSHNMYKFLFDTMDGIAYDDDKYLLPHEVFKGVDKQNPRIEIKLFLK